MEAPVGSLVSCIRTNKMALKRSVVITVVGVMEYHRYHTHLSDVYYMPCLFEWSLFHCRDAELSQSR